MVSNAAEPDVAPMASGSGFSSFFRYEYPRIVRELDFIIGDTEVAKEVAQEAFVKQYVQWSRIQRYDRPGAWVRRVAIRMANRVRRRAFLFDRSSVIEEVATREIDHAMMNDVRAAVAALAPMQRAAVVLHYYRDMSVVSVADSLGCREATAKSHLFKARARLAKTLIDYDN